MIIVRNIEELEDVIAGSCVTIGNFDGVHKGHQKLIQLACSRAKSQGLSALLSPLTRIRSAYFAMIAPRPSSP